MTKGSKPPSDPSLLRFETSEGADPDSVTHPLVRSIRAESLRPSELEIAHSSDLLERVREFLPILNRANQETLRSRELLEKNIPLKSSDPEVIRVTMENSDDGESDGANFFF